MDAPFGAFHIQEEGFGLLVVRGMEESDWPAVSDLVNAEWESNHPVVDKDFFFWQYGGYGEIAGVGATALAFVSNRLVGMRGVIPGMYQVPTSNGGYEYTPGGSFAMWIVERESRGTGIGKALLRHCENHLGVMVALGSNEGTSVPIYLKNGFSRQDGLHHWFTVLDSKGRHLLYGTGLKALDVSEIECNGEGDIREINNPQIAADVWLKFSKQYKVFGLHRHVEFWKWRYFDHPSFRYQVFADEDLTTLIVTRTETLVVDGCEVSVLRIIELFSSYGLGNNDSQGQRMASVLRCLISKAYESGISAVDHRNSTNLFGPALESAGFKFREMENIVENQMGFAGQLNPLVLGPRPINLHWKVKNNSFQGDEILYFVKSDNDMDRPNERGLRSPKLG